ncbi:putative mitochondrial protein [Trifolium repens]|nr:putative mitochondrial protein [Trifolium repens]
MLLSLTPWCHLILTRNNNSFAIINDNSFPLWHFRLGHANSNAVKTILQLCKIPYSSNSASLSLVSYYGYSYYITFVDTFTKYTWVYFLKSKADALTAFSQFLSLVQNQFQASIKALQSDWGGEFRPFTKLLNELGIIHRLTCPHTSHQNGTVERKHRQIVEMGLTLLSHASLPLKFWDHSFTQSVYLINKLPSSALPNMQSPHFALYKSHPDYTQLKTFGCLCFPHLRPYNKHKLQFRFSPCVYLGVSPQHKGHKCLDATGRIYISKDVVFHESQFPYHSMFNSSPISPPSVSYPTNVIFSSLDDDSSSSSPNTIPSPSPSVVTPNSPNTTTTPSVSSTNSDTLNPSAPLSVDHISPPFPNPAATSTPLPPIYPVISNHNDHSMVTRGKTGKLKPKVYLAELEPKNIKSALSDPKWTQAMQAEYKALMDNKTWSLVPLPPHRKAIGCKWIFRVKENPDGSVNKYKARLVAKGFSQTVGFDFTETFSPVIKPVTIRVILTLAVTYKWQVQQIDINNAFLNGVLQEEVYMSQPPGFVSSDKTLVCKLHKSLYGLKQAPRAWYDRLTSALLHLGFVKSKCDPSLMVHNQHGACTYVLIYVDDILITGSAPQLINDVITKLNLQFALKRLGPVDYFLGLEVHHLPSGALLLNQTKYVRDLLCKTNMEDSSPIGSPMVSSCRLSRFGTDSMSDPSLYRSVVGALQYATMTRPDIAFSVNRVCQFMANPLESHWKAVKRILRYLKGTLGHGLLISPSTTGPPFSLRAYSDADWATDQDDRRSTSGSCIYFGPNLVSWGSKKQTLVARSSTEAEYRSMANATADLLWIQSLVQELQVPFHTPTLLCDNLSAVSLSHNPVLHSKTKHLELDIHFVREKVLSKKLLVLHVPGCDQLADPLTKPLSPAHYAAIRTKLKVFAVT